MSKVDVTVIEKPVQFTPRPSFSSEKHLQVTDPEVASVEDGEDPELKLPKMSSLVVVLLATLLMQVSSRFSPT